MSNFNDDCINFSKMNYKWILKFQHNVNKLTKSILFSCPYSHCETYLKNS